MHLENLAGNVALAAFQQSLSAYRLELSICFKHVVSKGYLLVLGASQYHENLLNSLDPFVSSISFVRSSETRQIRLPELNKHEVFQVHLSSTVMLIRMLLVPLLHSLH